MRSVSSFQLQPGKNPIVDRNTHYRVDYSLFAPHYISKKTFCQGYTQKVHDCAKKSQKDAIFPIKITNAKAASLRMPPLQHLGKMRGILLIVFAVAMTAATGTTAGTGFFAAGYTIRAADTFFTLLFGADNEKYNGTENQHDAGNE